MGQQANLRVRVLGVLAVAVDGREVPAHELASRKGRTPLKLLLARRGAVVPADVLVEALWAGRPPADPDANLATLVSRLRAVLGPDAIAGDRQGWRFVAGTWAEVDLAEAGPGPGRRRARLALLGRGPFLADEPDADWALPARREAERLAARRRLATDAALAVGDPERALAQARAATTADPLDEPAWRAVMLAHASAGEPAAALAAYEQLRHTLAEELGTDPAPETQSLHLTILRGEAGVEGGVGAPDPDPPVVARRLAGDRLLVVATVRAEEGAEALAALADVARVLELGPLPAEAVAELARRFGVADMAGPVLERARGHTLFTVESLRALAEAGPGRAAVPASLRDAVVTRARRAGPEVETLLRAAVVVGAAFDLEVVAGLLDLPVEVAAARAERALAARLLAEDDTGAGYRFANDLVREVLYETTPRPTRVTRHRRLAGMLAGRPAAAWMAAAADAAGLFRPMLTSAFAAALACANLGDLRGALDRLALLERLLAEVEDRFYHARAATTGSWLWRELGDLGRSRALAEGALDLLGPAATGTHPGLHAQLSLAETALVAGDEAAAAGFVERAGGQLERPFGYRWRVELRHAELASRLDPPAATGSDYLLAQIAPPPQARAARDRIAGGLPGPLRSGFLKRGPLSRALRS
jgi:DNA-binding SARP family transcriptional activator